MATEQDEHGFDARAPTRHPTGSEVRAVPTGDLQILSARALDLLSTHLRALGVFALLLCIGTWALDIAKLVHPCVYCRTQRTAIGAAGVLMMLPNPREWWVRYPVGVICFFGANISAAQLFLIVRSINSGEPFGKLNLFMATGALFTLCGQALLVFMRNDSER